MVNYERVNMLTIISVKLLAQNQIYMTITVNLTMVPLPALLPNPTLGAPNSSPSPFPSVTVLKAFSSFSVPGKPKLHLSGTHEDVESLPFYA